MQAGAEDPASSMVPAVRGVMDWLRRIGIATQNDAAASGGRMHEQSGAPKPKRMRPNKEAGAHGRPAVSEGDGRWLAKI